MGESTKIEWAHHTFNPWRGCTKVSPGCQHCYAETLSKRNPAVLGVWGDKGTRVVAAESYWRLPVRWNREAEKAGERRRVFCASLADVCEDRPELVAPRRRLMMLILDTPHLDWLLLSKRPENFARLFDWSVLGCFDADEWPPNVWLGTTTENQEMAEKRIPELLRIPAAVRFLSLEPMLGPVELELQHGCRGCNHPGNLIPTWNEHGRCSVCDGTRHEPSGIHWVIVGGESGPPTARPMAREWVRSVVGDCEDAGVPVFVKQFGRNPVLDLTGDGDLAFDMNIKHHKGALMGEWPEDLRVRQVPIRTVESD